MPYKRENWAISIIYPPGERICSTKLNNKHHQYILLLCGVWNAIQRKTHIFTLRVIWWNRDSHLKSIFMSHFEVRNYYAFQAHAWNMSFQCNLKRPPGIYLYVYYIVCSVIELKWNQITLQKTNHFYCVYSFHWNLRPDPSDHIKIATNSRTDIYLITIVCDLNKFILPCVQQTHYKTIPDRNGIKNNI